MKTLAVRRESVVLDLEGNFTRKTAEAAVAADLLDRKVKGLGGSSTSTGRDLDNLGSSTNKSGNAFTKSSAEIDKYSGRMRVLVDTALILGPALEPIGALAVPAVAGLAAQFGAAALAAGTALLAFQGVGNTLKLVNAAALDPTTENLQKAHDAMAGLSPAAADFVRELQHLQPLLKDLEGSAASGLFPGLTEALQTLTSKAPQLERIVGEIGSTLGSLSSEGAHALAGSSFQNFFDYIEREAPKILSDLGHSIGAVVHGISQLAVATDPLQQDFGSWMLHAAQGFDKWATGLSKTKGFEDFVAYVEQHGPEVADAVAAIGNALLQIVEAGAPLGGPTLKALTAVAQVIAKLADSKAGPALLATAQALAILSRAQSAFGKAGASGFAQSLQGLNGLAAQRGAFVKGAAAAAGFVLEVSGAADKSWLLNTASLGLMGSIAGPWGAALGAGVGLLEHFAGGQKSAVTDTQTLTATLDQQTGAITENTAAYVAKQFADNGVLQDAQKLGLSLSDVTQAALGNTDALARVNTQASAYQSTIAGSATKQNEFADTFGTVRDAISGTNSQLTTGQKKLLLLAAATGTTAGSFKAAKSAAQEFTDQIDHLNNVLSKRSSLRDYQAALDAFTKGLKDNGKTLDINTAKGRANQANLDAIAATAIQVAQNLHGVDKVNFMAKARGDFIDAAAKILGTRDAAKKLADSLGLVGKINAKPGVDLDTANFYREQHGVLAALNGMDGKTVRTFIDVTTRHFGGDPGLADAHGAGHARGGLITGPGGPTDDRVPIMASNKEYMIRAAAVDYYGVGFFNQVNAMRLAGGGPTSGRSNSPGPNLSWVDVGHGIESTAAALATFKSALAGSTKALDKAKSAYSSAVSNRDSLASTISSSLGLDSAFTKSAASSNPWMAGASGGSYNVTGNLNSITATADQELADIKTLVGNGVKGPALQALLAQGPDLVHSMAQMSQADLSAEVAAYSAASSAIAAVSAYGANVVDGPAVKQAHHDMVVLQNQVRLLNHSLNQAAKDNNKGHKKTAHAAATSGTTAASNARRRGRGH